MSISFDSKLFQSIIGSWYESLKHPKESQSNVLSNLISNYCQTDYGKDHSSFEIKNIKDFQRSFPILNYELLNPYFLEVQKGNYKSILSEPLISWVMTRGSTGKAKVLPATKTHLEQIFKCGARALVNHAVKRKDFRILTGKILNLNFPSRVHSTDKDDPTSSYGYSSGTYARLNPIFGKVSLVPRQEDIDALGSGINTLDWEKRFDLTYNKALGENVTAAIGVTPVILSFARYIKKKYQKKINDIWNIKALFCTSVRKIQFKYAPLLRKYFGKIPIVEIYSATEGVFAQQIDDLPYVTPNYDTYFFEVKTVKKIKLLCDLKRGEWGKLIISSCMFPRYDIGDLIEAAGNNYFRIIGRNNFRTLLEQRLYRLLFKWVI